MPPLDTDHRYPPFQQSFETIQCSMLMGCHMSLVANRRELVMLARRYMMGSANTLKRVSGLRRIDGDGRRDR